MYHSDLYKFASDPVSECRRLSFFGMAIKTNATVDMSLQGHGARRPLGPGSTVVETARSTFACLFKRILGAIIWWRMASFVRAVPLLQQRRTPPQACHVGAIQLRTALCSRLSSLVHIHSTNGQAWIKLYLGGWG
jgi:hypothetical protein